MGRLYISLDRLKTEIVLVAKAAHGILLSSNGLLVLGAHVLARQTDHEIMRLAVDALLDPLDLLVGRST